MAQRFVSPPNWPQPPAGWVPPEGWNPDPAWGPAPEGWQFWVDEPAGWQAPAPPPWAPPPGPPPGPAPSVAKTVVITVLFGLFGLIPAYLDAEKAKRSRQPAGKYWVAFGASLAGSAALWVLTIVALTATLLHSAPVASTGAGSSPLPTQQSTPAPTAAAPTAGTTGADGTVACNYTPDTSGNPNLVDVGLPPNPDRVPAHGTVTLTTTTNRGTLTFTLDRSEAPCAAESFAYLASKGFFDNSPCHREVNQPTFGVLQCGDPTGTGQGGPSYTYREETTQNTTYPRGTIAMANTGQPNSTASQFFLCFTDTDLPPDYSVVGTVDDAGLAVLDRITAAGNDGSFGSMGGGKPRLPVTITSMAVG